MDTTSTNNYDDGLEINGLLVDQTLSKIGKEFYEMFYSNWNPPEVGFNYSFLFQEKPMPSLGTQITILINDIVVFQRFVQPRYDLIEEIVYEAINESGGYIVNYEALQKQLKFDEMEGTGIY